MNHPCFRKEIEPLRKNSARVLTMVGCLVSEERVSDLVERNRKGTVRLKGPQESLQDWLRRHPRESEQGFQLDILGSGWPEILVRSRSGMR